MSVNNNQGWMRDCKKRCVVEENMEDRISNLPDDVVGHILSRLPTKDALKTSVLSRTWEKKWTSIYDIDIDDISNTRYMFPDDKVARFVNYVNKILVGTLRIRRFSLRCFKGLYDACDLEAWISCVSKRNVESINISVPLSKRLDLKWCLLIWTCLKELELCLTCTLVLPVNNCFPNLKRLILAYGTPRSGRIKIKAERISSERRIILSFPVLEVLSLKGCIWKDVDFVEIHAPELITLETMILGDLQKYEIQVFGSKLAMFRSLGGSMKNFYLRTPAVSSAEFIGQDLGENLALLKQLTGITCLKLWPTAVDVLLSLKSGLVFPTFDRLTELHICGLCSIKDILELLQLLPPLESLYLNVWGNDHGTCQLWPPKIVSVLKKVELDYFYGNESELKFSAFVLENARNLKQMSIIMGYQLDMTVVTHVLSALIPESSSCKLVVSKRFH